MMKVALSRPIRYTRFTVLDGEVAVPCTRNPLQRGRIPVFGLVDVRSDFYTKCWRSGPPQWTLVNPVRSGRKQP